MSELEFKPCTYICRNIIIMLTHTSSLHDDKNKSPRVHLGVLQATKLDI